MKLRKEVDQIIKQACDSVQQFPWENRAAYVSWLSQTYHYTSHSTRLLALAASRLEDAVLHARFLEHIREENGHEKLAINDLKAMGEPVGECLPETHALYMTQYYYLEHRDPTAIFGWILCLEGVAAEVGLDLFARAKEAHGEKAATFLKLHGTADKDHVQKAYAMLDHIKPASAAGLIENMKLSGRLYLTFLRACAEQGAQAPKFRVVA